MNSLGKAAESKLRSVEEIAAAHDRLVAIILEEVPNPFPDAPLDRAPSPLQVAADVLCWVLGHDHNRTFAENLDKIDGFLVAHAYRLTGVEQVGASGGEGVRAALLARLKAKG